MNNLKETLGKYNTSLHKLGDDTSKKTSSLQAETLKVELSAISKKNAFIFWICVTMIISLFIGSIIFISIFINDSKKIELGFGTGGVVVSILGLITYMKNLWKEKVNSDLLLALVGSMNEDAMNSIISVIISKL